MRAIVWFAAVLLLLGAAMLLASIGAAAVWIAVITVGIVLVIIGQRSLDKPAKP